MNIARTRREQGNTLVLTLVLVGTIAMVLGSYLVLMSSRYKVTARSQCWNGAIPALEAGIEEALTHLQDDLNNPTGNGWTQAVLSGQSVYSKRRQLADGSY